MSCPLTNVPLTQDSTPSSQCRDQNTDNEERETQITSKATHSMESNGDGDSCETNREVENGKAASIVKEADDLQNTNEGAPEVVVTVKKITRNDEQVPKSLQTSDPHQATRAVGDTLESLRCVMPTPRT